MARYRKIEVRIWNDQKFRALSDQGKLAFLFLLSHPHMTSLGAMRATLAGLASELGWTTKAFREAFGEALAKGIAKHDEDACFVGLPNFIKHNPPESPNVVKSWRDQVDLLPECELKHELLQHVKGFVEGLGEAFAKALPEAFAKGMPNPEPEPEPKPKPDPYEEPNTGRSRGGVWVPPTVAEVRAHCLERRNGIDPEEFVAYYEARGWVLSNGKKCSNWKSCIVTWEKKRNGQRTNGPGTGTGGGRSPTRIDGTGLLAQLDAEVESAGDAGG